MKLSVPLFHSLILTSVLLSGNYSFRALGTPLMYKAVFEATKKVIEEIQQVIHLHKLYKQAQKLDIRESQVCI